MKRDDAIAWFETTITFLKDLSKDADVELIVDCPNSGRSLPIEINMFHQDIGLGDQPTTAGVIFLPIDPYRFDVFEEEENDCE